MDYLFTRTLFVGAHADDVELFAGGTIARFADCSKVLTFSRHRGVKHSPPEEFEWSMRLLGISPKHSEVLDLPACQPPPASFADHHKVMYDRLVWYSGVYQPSMVVTHQSTDTNQDHRFVYELVLRVFKNRCSIICGEFPHNDLPKADRRMFIEITGDCLMRKIEALECYQSQRATNRPYLYPDRMELVARLHGYNTRSEYAEAFEVVQLWL